MRCLTCGLCMNVWLVDECVVFCLMMGCCFRDVSWYGYMCVFMLCVNGALFVCLVFLDCIVA